MTDRFDFEQQIMKCWNVTDDMDYIAQYVSNLHMDAKDQDKVMNMLFGLKDMYDVKFQYMFDTFEKMIKEGQIKTPELKSWADM